MKRGSPKGIILAALAMIVIGCTVQGGHGRHSYILITTTGGPNEQGSQEVNTVHEGSAKGKYPACVTRPGCKQSDWLHYVSYPCVLQNGGGGTACSS